MMVSEAARERETFRYYPFLAAYFRYARDGNVFPSAELANAPDSALTAIAVLGAHQTKTERAFISLFDSTQQYVLVEATPSRRIVANLPSEDSHTPLALRGTAIPRSQGTCDHVLYLKPEPDTTGVGAGAGAGAAELPLSLVPNLATDSRFTTRPYCQFREGGQFYAGVPIRTRRGIDIGAYCVMSSKPPADWNEESTQFMRDISRAIMEHLEFRRAAYESRQHTRMNRGLGSFLEGKSTIGGWLPDQNHDAFEDDGRAEGSLMAQRQRYGLETQEQGQEHEMPKDADTPTPNTLGRTPSGTVEAVPPSHNLTLARRPLGEQSSLVGLGDDSAPPSPSPVVESLKANQGNSNRILLRAANVIREGFEVEACVFLASPSGFYKDELKPSTTQTADEPRPPQSNSNSGTDEHHQGSSGEAPEATCDVLAISTTETSSVPNAAATSTGSIGRLPRRLLAKLLRRYPKGQIFNFDADGGVQSSDYSDSEHVPPTPSIEPGEVASETPSALAGNSAANRSNHHTKPARPQFGRAKEAVMIGRAFPSARSVAFVPVWDAKAERWLAGGFIYTRSPTRVFTTDCELNFFVGFAKVIAAEINGLEAAMADKAKSDILGSLSHELRSPLHGAILSTELLNDTDLTIFQGNAAHTIETCCRTLLDTIEHLLDFAKVNSFAKEDQPSKRSHQQRFHRKDSAQFGKKSLYIDARLDQITEEVVESVYAGFTFQQTSAQLLSMQIPPGEFFAASRKTLDGDSAVEYLDGQGGQKLKWGGVFLHVFVDPSCRWRFHMQPGMIRRIVMNLVGNALKYTSDGIIKVSLEQDKQKSSASQQIVTITVQDTGCGIGEDFLRHRLFQPFAQEDELQPGTGLGLSLVKKMTSQLRGRVSVRSRVGVGTTVKITLPLRVSPQPSSEDDGRSEEDKEFDDHTSQLAGLRVCILGFGPAWSEGGRALMEDTCRRWLRLEVVDGEDLIPDIIIRSEDVLPHSLDSSSPYMTTPNVVLCRHAPAAAQLSAEFKDTNQNHVFEFMPQPVGPRNLAKSMLLAYRRWVGLPNKTPKSRPPGPVRARSIYAQQREAASSNVDDLLSPAISLKENLPYEVPAPKETRDNPLAIDSTPPITGHEPDGPGPQTVRPANYLLVDDNSINLRVLSAFIKKLGGRFELASNGQEALDAYIQRASTFTAILMDISMPIMNGLEATRRIRAHEHREHLQPATIVALTGLASDSTQQEALESGVDEFLTKPVTLKMLSKAFEQMGL